MGSSVSRSVIIRTPKTLIKYRKKMTLITISSTDNSVIRFLQEFQRNSLLTNANLDFRFRAMSPEPNSFPQFMANFWPLFTTINSVRIEGGALDCIQCEHFDLAKPMMASARILYSLYNCRDCWFGEWLHTPREDGMPRILVLDSPGYDYSHLHFIRHDNQLPHHFPNLQMQSTDHVHHNAIAMSKNLPVSSRPNIINMISPMQSQQVPYQVIPKNMGHNPHIIPSGRSQAIADQHQFVSAPHYAMHNHDLAYHHQLISDERSRGEAIAASVQRQKMVQQAPGAHHNHTAPPQFHTNHHPVNEAKAIHYPQVITNSHQFVPAHYDMNNGVRSPVFAHDSLAVNQHISPYSSGLSQYHNPNSPPPIQVHTSLHSRLIPPQLQPSHPIHPPYFPPQVHYPEPFPPVITALPQSQNVAVSHSQSEVLKKLVDIEISNNFVQVSNQLPMIKGDEGRDKLCDFFAQFDLCTQNWAESDKIRLLKGKVKGKASKSLNVAIQKFGEKSFNVLKTEILSTLRDVDVNEASAFAELNYFGSRHPNEDIVSFANRTQKLVTCSFPHLSEIQLDETCKKFFIANLQDENLARFLECQSKNSQSFDELIMVANKLEMLDKVKLKARVDPHPDIGYYHHETAPPSVNSSSYPVPKYNTPKVFYPPQSTSPLNSQNIHSPKVSRANAPVKQQVQWSHPENNNAIHLFPSPEIQDESPALNCGHISAKESPDFLEIFQELESMNDYESLPLISNKEISPKFSDQVSKLPNSPAISPHSPNSSPTVPHHPLNSPPVIPPNSPNSPPTIQPHSPHPSPTIPDPSSNSLHDIPPQSIPITFHIPPIQTKSDIPNENEIIDSHALHSPPKIPHKHQRKKGKKKGRNAPNSKSKKVELLKNGLKEKSPEKVTGQTGQFKLSNSVSSSIPEPNKLGGTSSRVGGGKASAGSRFSAVSHRKEFSRVKAIIRSDQAVGEILSRPQSLLAGNFPKPTLSRPPSLFSLKFSILHHPQSLLEGNFPNPIRPPSLLALKFSIPHRPQSLLVGNFPNPILFNSHHSYQALFGISFSGLEGTLRT